MGTCLRPLALLDERRGLETVQLRHLHVQEDERELVLEECPERLLARGGLDEIAAERLEHGLEGEQVLRDVVDEQDVGTLVGAHAATCSTRLRTNGAISWSGRTASAATTAAAALGSSPRTALTGSSTIAAPPRSLTRVSPATPSRPRPGQDDPDRALAVRVGRRLEQDVDRGAAVVDGPLGREGEAARLDEKVIVGRREVDAPRLDRLLVVHVGHLERAAPLEGALELAAGGDVAVLRDRDGDLVLGRQPLQKRGERLHPAPGGADDDEVQLRPPSGRRARPCRSARSGPRTR